MGQDCTTLYAEVNPKVGGQIKIGYEDPDQKYSFDLVATISEFTKPTRLAYILGLDIMIPDDSRLVTYDLSEVEGRILVKLEVDLENLHSKDLQIQGWSTHLNNLATIYKN